MSSGLIKESFGKTYHAVAQVSLGAGENPIHPRNRPANVMLRSDGVYLAGGIAAWMQMNKKLDDFLICNQNLLSHLWR